MLLAQLPDFDVFLAPLWLSARGSSLLDTERRVA
jgi:hypothetical protein